MNASTGFLIKGGKQSILKEISQRMTGENYLPATLFQMIAALQKMTIAKPFVFIVFMMLVGTPDVVFGQVESIDEAIEKYAEAQELQRDYSELADELSEHQRRPVNLNTTKPAELNEIPMLSTRQLSALINYRNTYGEIFTLYELQSIPGFDSAFIMKIEPYVTILPASSAPRFTIGNLIKLGRHDLLMRIGQDLPASAGYKTVDSVRMANPDSYYPGNPQKYYFRYRYTWFDKIQVAVAGEKDPGEQFFRGNQSSGFDYYAAALQLTNIGILKNLTIGNFKVNFGQGLTIGTGMALGAVPGFSGGQSRASGIRSNLSMDETGSLKGLAATLKISHFEISAFLSRAMRTGTIRMTDTLTNKVAEISSLTGTGLHRTATEVSKKNTVTELLAGGHAGFTASPSQGWGFRIGVTGTWVSYSAVIKPIPHVYNQFNFTGNSNYNLGFDFQLRVHRLYLSGEIARSANGAWAGITGFIFTPDPNVSISATYRNYSSGYQNLFSNAFGQNSMNSNEEGLFVSLNAGITPKITLSGYVDLCRFPWVKFRVDAPTRCIEWGLFTTLQLSRNSAIQIRYNRKATRENNADMPDVLTHKLVDQCVSSFRVTFDLNPVEVVNLKSRIELKHARLSGKEIGLGYLIYQDIQVNTRIWVRAITMRVGIFDIPGYETRIYAYEPEVLYGYSVPCFEGSGIRSCLVLKMLPLRKVTLWLRGAVVWYAGRMTVGNGNDLTNGNMRAEIAGQIQIRL